MEADRWKRAKAKAGTSKTFFFKRGHWKKKKKTQIPRNSS